MQNMFRSGVAFFYVGLHALQAQARECDVNKSLRRLSGQPASPVGPRQVVSETCAHPAPSSAQPATSDVLLFLFEYSRPQSVGSCRPAQILLPKTRPRLVHRPSLPSYVTPYFRVRVHAHKIGLVARLVRPEAQPSCL